MHVYKPSDLIIHKLGNDLHVLSFPFHDLDLPAGENELNSKLMNLWMGNA